MPQVDFEQALAFVEALTGWETVGYSEENSETVERPKSPHAITHLQAVLGARYVATSNIFEFCANYPAKSQRAMAKNFIAYLRGVARALERGIKAGELK